MPRDPISTKILGEASCTLPAPLAEALESPQLVEKATTLWAISAGYAPYLARIAQRRQSAFVAAVHGIHDAFATSILAHMEVQAQAASLAEWMREARAAKESLALIVALADVSGSWQLARVTHMLAEFADVTMQSALEFLLADAVRKGEWQAAEGMGDLASQSGITILGMGKLGAFELNYSSDIDIIVLFDPDRAPYIGSRNTQHFMNRLVQNLVHMLQERTEHGYVLRTDIRLRPDPMSTPPAVSVQAALHYYETVGQNWERAAMIKARPIAGDETTSAYVLQELVPYIWRKNLDFNTIADINSIMRQMHAHTSVPQQLEGHNVKTGIGGIRSIEFFVQTQQLVWGGRNPMLRDRATLDALTALHEAALVDNETCATLHDAYHYLRTLEHRLQMLEDAQTHSLPTSAEGMKHIAHFMGFADTATFVDATRRVLTDVQRIYAGAMHDSTPLSAGGNLVFTGVEHDPETLVTLRAMGYAEAERVSSIIQGWHRGHRRSTRSKRSRQLLTEMVPTLLTKLAEANQPDTAFFQFDDFLNRLPSGVQIFSLIQARPEILAFLTHILGSAAALGHTISSNPLLLDAMMEPEFFMPLPGKAALEEEADIRTMHAQDLEQRMLLLRIFQNEKRFQAGAHMLKHLAPVSAVGRFLTDLAEIVLHHTLRAVMAAYPSDEIDLARIPVAVLGFGKLGAHDLTFDSDLDLVIVYDDTVLEANDADVRKHMHRISQRFINALTTMTREGRLYEIDTRLRPGGGDGPLAVSMEAFDRYFTNQAWTFEFMALTKARVIAYQNDDFVTRLRDTITKHIVHPRDADTCRNDLFIMRDKVAQEFGTSNAWNIKYVRGGMMDVEFMAQYLVLTQAAVHPELYRHNASEVFAVAKANGVLTAEVADALMHAYEVLSICLSYQRLCVPGGIITHDTTAGLFVMMAKALQLANTVEVQHTLLAAEETAYTLMQRLQNSGNL